ncbi:MAG: hypothetical protein WA790_10470 [Sulfitobacter sp.]
MYRRFITTIAAASIAITALGAAPARADDKDAARALAAILGIAVIGKIIHDNKKDKERAVTRRHSEPRVQPRRRSEPHVQPRRRHSEPQVQPRPLPRQVRNNKLLPSQCFRSFDTRRGTVRMFGNRCLQNNYRHANRLPQHCKVRVNTYNGKRTGYQARCLRDAGYRLARG